MPTPPPPPTTSTKLSLTDVWNARQNLSTIDLALGEIRRLLDEKESLEADIQSLLKEKEELTNEVRGLRKSTGKLPSTVSTTRSSASSNKVDLEYGLCDNDSDSGSIGEEDKELSISQRLAKAPKHFVCPLTLQVMRHPLQQKDKPSINYERGAILEWIYFGKATCPLTRKVLHPADFIPNNDLQFEIEAWKAQHGVAEEEVDEDMDGSGDNNLVCNITPDQEQQAMKRMSSVKKSGSDAELFTLRDRVLAKRNERLERRLSNGSLINDMSAHSCFD